MESLPLPAEDGQNQHESSGPRERVDGSCDMPEGLKAPQAATMNVPVSDGQVAPQEGVGRQGDSNSGAEVGGKFALSSCSGQNCVLAADARN